MGKTIKGLRNVVSTVELEIVNEQKKANSTSSSDVANNEVNSGGNFVLEINKNTIMHSTDNRASGSDIALLGSVPSSPTPNKDILEYNATNDLRRSSPLLKLYLSTSPHAISSADKPDSRLGPESNSRSEPGSGSGSSSRLGSGSGSNSGSGSEVRLETVKGVEPLRSSLVNQVRDVKGRGDERIVEENRGKDKKWERRRSEEKKGELKILI